MFADHLVQLLRFNTVFYIKGTSGLKNEKYKLENYPLLFRVVQRAFPSTVPALGVALIAGNYLPDC